MWCGNGDRQRHQFHHEAMRCMKILPTNPYEQPNFYNETCANIGTGMFNYRMFMLTGEPKYAEWTEQMMYNTLNSAVDLEGEHWFYAIP